jgi:hypothetical protein
LNVLSDELVLPDGEYVIKRVLPDQPRAFETEADAQAWLEKARTSPASLVPSSEYFRLILTGSDVLVHQLRVNNGSNLVPNGNFCVSVADVSWAFEEFANRVTILSNRFEASQSKVPVAGLLEAGLSFADELRTLGLRELASASYSDVGWSQVGGMTRRGERYAANVARDNQGRITNVLSTLSGSTEPELKIDLSWKSRMCSWASHSRFDLRSRRWREAVRYEVLRSMPSPDDFALSTYWTHFTNSATEVLVYDAEADTLAQFSAGRLISVQMDPRHEVVLENSPWRRVVVVLLMFAVTAVWVAFLLKSSKRGRTRQGAP